MKRRSLKLLALGCFIAIAASGAWIWERLWFPVAAEDIKAGSAKWLDAEIVKCPSNDQRYFVFRRSSGAEEGYIVDLNRRAVSIPNMSFWRFLGVVLPKEPDMKGVRMAPFSDKAPYDPQLIVGTNGRSFSFRNVSG